MPSALPDVLRYVERLQGQEFVVTSNIKAIVAEWLAKSLGAGDVTEEHSDASSADV